MGVDILIEDLDLLVEIARKELNMAGWLQVANSAAEIRQVLEKQVPKKIIKTGMEFRAVDVETKEIYTYECYPCPECEKWIIKIYKYCPHCEEKLRRIEMAIKKVLKVSREDAEHIIRYRKPLGLFYRESNGMFIGIDNSTGDAWTEDFDRLEDCIRWLTEEEKPINEIDEADVYRKALMTYGKDVQITMVFEEMAELQKELCKALRGKKVTGNIAEEIADVEIMLEQMKILFEIEDMVESLKQYKVKRLRDRIVD